jgi:hypothetical protein
MSPQNSVTWVAQDLLAMASRQQLGLDSRARCTLKCLCFPERNSVPGSPLWDVVSFLTDLW